MKPFLELSRMRLLLLVRQPEIVFWAFVFPILLSMVLGLAFRSRTLAPSPVAVLAGARAPALVERLAADPALAPRLVQERAELERLLRSGAVDAVLEAPDDGARPSVRYDPERAEAELARLRIERLLADPPEALERVPDEEGAPRFVDWFVPGLLALSIMSTSVWAVGFAFVEARQKRLIKRFLVTPMPRASYLLSVVAARMVLLVLEVALLVLFARLVLGVPLRGSFLSFALLAALGALAFAGMGVLLGSRSRTPEAAAGLINLAMMPMGLAGGVFFSYERFADSLQAVVRYLPLTAFADAMRAVQLEGRPLASLGPEIGILVAWGAVSFALGLAIFRWK